MPPTTMTHSHAAYTPQLPYTCRGIHRENPFLDLRGCTAQPPCWCKCAHTPHVTTSSVRPHIVLAGPSRESSTSTWGKEPRAASRVTVYSCRHKRETMPRAVRYATCFNQILRMRGSSRAGDFPFPLSTE